MRRPWFALPLLAVAGCGDAAYEADFRANTLPYYEQRQALDTALSAPWEKFGLSVRVPRRFEPVDPPPKPTKEQLEDEYWEPPADARQPEYLLDPLPGLKGAWRGPAGKEGEKAGHRWLYVLDTAKLEEDEYAPALNPDDFAYEIADRFARSMENDGRYLDTPEPEQFKAMPFPTSPQPFAPTVQYRTPPAPLIGDFGDGVPHQVELYVHRSGGRTTILALVMPAEAMQDPALGSSRDLMLQTLTTSNSAAAPAGPAASGPGGGPGF